ncbi:hypothetical protein SCHPADRAFT_947957 [Schizopora paradoxa]|uniref:Uncharacterized protein n=1 Tax=Schizopora paradoxa TaxID=27342 RepID=A0A0H2R3P3_9AGAM|nr:hypothetical protein SCHPADRAFT_947957 [Schizopora paradoxa]
MPVFFNRICSSMPPDMLSTCYDRLTTMNVGMDITMHSESVEATDFIRMAMGNSKNWRHYIHFSREIGEVSVADLEDLASTTHELDAPSLISVSIHYPPSTTALIQEELRQDALCYFRTWTMPKLMMLKLSNIIPSPFVGSASLRQLSLQIGHEGVGNGMFNLQALVAFLVSCVLLEELDIELVGVASLWQVIATNQHASVGSVNRINFTFRDCNIRVVKPMMEVLSFPNVRSMQLRVLMFYDSLTMVPEMPRGDVHDFLPEIFPDRTALPKLLHLRLCIDITRSFRPIQVSLPFAALTNIKHLYLDVRDSILAPIPSGISLPSLRSLSLKHCRKLEVDWITSLLDVLKASRTFQPTQLEVESCRWTKYPVFAPSGELSTLTEQELANHYVDVTVDEMRQLMLAWRRKPGLSGPSKSVSTIGAWSGEQAEDFAQTYGQTYIEEESFPILADILHLIQNRHGHLTAQQEWFDEMCPSEPVTFDYESKATQAVEDVQRATAARDALKIASRALLQLSECISFQATVAEKHVKTLQRRSGFSSLPDEILSIVLENAAYAADDHDRDSRPFNLKVTAPIRTVKSATRLSHSCRRFRRLILDIPVLYSCTCSFMPPDMASTCCDRLKATNGGMDVRLYNENMEFREAKDFIHMAMKNSKNWHYYTHCYSFPGGNGEVSVADLEDLAKATYKLDVPSLISVSIYYPSWTATLIQEGLREDPFHYIKTWTMPKLSSLKLSNVIPSPFAGSTSLRQLSLRMNYDGTDNGMFKLQTLIAFLVPCVLLEELAIELYFVADVLRWAAPTEPHASFDRINRVEFTFHECSIRAVKSVMAALNFPKIRAVVLRISILYGFSSEDPDLPLGDVDDIFQAIFSDSTAFSKLLDLQLYINTVCRTFED